MFNVQSDATVCVFVFHLAGVLATSCDVLCVLPFRCPLTASCIYLRPLTFILTLTLTLTLALAPTLAPTLALTLALAPTLAPTLAPDTLLSQQTLRTPPC
jgi:hypothetical protein